LPAWVQRFVPALSATLASLAISTALIFHRPDIRGAGFLFGDEASNLYVADAVQHGRRLFVDAAYPYGPAAIELYARIGGLFGNTPLTYLIALAVLTALSTGAAAHFVSRAANTRTTLAIILVGLLPTMPVPGAPIGGFISSIYYPLERFGLLAAMLLWRPPAARSAASSIAIGAVLGFCQGVRFGPGIVMLLAVAAVDALAARRGSMRDLFRATGWLVAGFAGMECLWMAWAFLTLPSSIAGEVLWPLQMWETHRAGGASRWPGWAGWRMGITQGVMPVAAIVLALVHAVRSGRARSSQSTDGRAGDGALVASLFFAAGAFGFFRTEFHFRQFAWMLPLAAAPAVARLPGRAAAVLLVVCLPALWPIASAFRQARHELVELRVPRGFSVFVSPEVAGQVRALEPYTRDGPVLFVPNGAGWLYAYGVRSVTRHTWFYSSAVVRPFEERQFENEARGAAVMIRCAPPTAAWPFRPSLESFLTSAFREVSARGECTFWVPSEGR
jgi:hypothetical protein